ncbi:NMDA receptor synaptonuclear signaling and neuronal migration factor-like isoform X2 [Pomacea canaliculata]|nr:NMDA receptor synaptonuclear signaling and neuronal migration factor-like isoform X2 [Pomacea canaliculata]
MALQWPGRFKQRKQLNHNRKLTSVTVNNSKASSEKDDELKVPTAALHTLSIHPKQFVLSSHQDDVAMDLERCSPNGSTIEPPDEALPEHRVEEMKRAWEELQGFSDLDYMLPHHLDQLLRQEGVDDGVVDNTVAMGKLRHDRANYLNRLYHVKRRKYLSRPSRFSKSLPPIHIAQPRRSKSQEQEPERLTIDVTVEDRRERRKSRQRPWTESAASGHTRVANLPKILQPSKEEQQNLLDCKAKEEFSLFKSEVERLRWEAERQEEMLRYPTDFIQPRLVLISSKVPRCRSMSKAVRKGDANILYIIYDFETCSLQDLLDSVQSNLESCRPGCKAKSVCLISQGSHGCLYLLRGLVMTPQKLRRPAYEKVREFLKDLAFFISKVSEAHETTLHLLGGQLENEQGRQLIEEMQRAMLPNFINITAIDERSRAGRENIEQYFNFRKFLLWRTKVDSRPGLMDSSDVTRSWSSLAEDAEGYFVHTGQG